MKPLPFVRTASAVLFLCALPGLRGAGAIAEEPGAENPIRNPANLAIFQVNDVGMLASSGSAANTTLLDFAAANANLTHWMQAGQRLKSDDNCQESSRRRLISGRVSTPKFEQPICINRYGVSLYTGQRGIATGEFLPYQFTDPGISGNARDFAAASGLLDQRADKHELQHMGIAMARRNLKGRQSLDIIGYRPASSKNAEALISLAAWKDLSDYAVSGDVAIAIGDYDNDGNLDILTAADTSTGEQGPGRILLRSFSYVAKKQKLTLESTYVLDTAARPRSLNLAAGDFGSLGFDQAIVAYYTQGGTLELGFLRLGKKLKIDGPSPRGKLLATTPASGSFFEMAPGLFHFDPRSSQGSNPAFAFHTRQLALAWADAGGNTWTQIVSISPQLTQFSASPAQQVGSREYPSRTEGVGPALAIGNFIGLQNDNVSPLDQLAIVIPTRSDATQTASIPQLVVATATYSAEKGNFSIQQAWSDRQPIFESSGQQYSPGAVGLDSRGISYYLGTPLHIQVQDLIDPQYVIYMPPRHVDCLLMKPGDEQCQVVDVSGDTNFTVQLVDSKEETLQQTTTDQMATDFGSSASLSVSGTVGGGVMEIAEVEATTTAKTTFSYEQQVMERNISTHYQSKMTQSSATTSVDDHLIWNARTLDIWRYPVYGMNLSVPQKYPYYDVLIPGRLMQYSAGGRSVDWFSPSHMNNTLLSYPNIADPNFPQDLGDFKFNDSQGKQVAVREPLNSRVVRSFDGNMQTFELSYTDEAGGSTEKSFSYNLSNSSDISVGFKASAKIELVDVSAETEGTVSLTAKASWENSQLSERSVKNSRGITLNQPEVDWATERSYNYLSLIYITQNGGLKVAHAVDPLGTMGGRGWWKSAYGGRPDPALNLPNRMVYSREESQWILNPDESSYSQMRGISVTSATYDEATKTYPYLTGGVEEGTPVRVAVKLYNLSLDTVAKGVKVKFAYQKLDPASLAPIGKPITFATSQPLDLPVWQIKEIAEVWPTTGLAGDDGTPYRFVITLDTGGMDEIHGNDPKIGGNNRGTWPWSGSYFAVFKAGTKAQLAKANAVSANKKSGLTASADSARVSVATHPAQKGAPAMAEVTIESRLDDPSLRHLLLVRQDTKAGEPLQVVASRTLWGAYKGKQRLQIPLHNLSAPLPPLRAILTAGK